MSNLIEAKVGSEQHSSAWGKGNLQGTPKLVAENYQRDRHNSYTEGAVEISEGTVISWWMSAGDKYGTHTADFYILKSVASAEMLELTGGCYGRGNYLKGNFEILAHADGKTKAPRLMKWWSEWAKMNGGQNEEMARHLAVQIEKRGKNEPDKINA